MQATLEPRPPQNYPQGMADFLGDIADRMDSQHPPMPRPLPGFPERPQPEAHAAAPLGQQVREPEAVQAEHPSEHNAFLETNTRPEDITFGPGWLAKAKERWTGARLRARLALGAVALAVVAPIALANVVVPDSEGKAIGQSEDVKHEEELPIGSGYAEAVERRADDVDFTIESMVTGEKQWDVLRMEASQSPLQKAQAAAHNAMVGAQSFDPRLANVLGADVRFQAKDLLDEEGALEIDLADDEELFEEAQTGGEITVQGPATVRNAVSIQTMRPSEKKPTHNVTFTFTQLGPGEDLTLTGMEMTPMQDQEAPQE